MTPSLDNAGITSCDGWLYHWWLRLILALVTTVGPSHPAEDGVVGVLTSSPTPEVLTTTPSARQVALQSGRFWPQNDTWLHAQFLDFDHTHFDEMGVTRYPRTTSGPRTPEPVFDTDLVTEVTVPLGSSAILKCRVRHLAGRPVSWVRRRDWHILTSGPVTYTNDDRFQVLTSSSPDEWNLEIKYVQKRDNGTYECQVATGSGTISHFFNLVVVVPKAFILGTGDYHISEGTTISLVCIIDNSPVAPQLVVWYHNDRAVGYDAGASGVSVITEPGPRTHSRLAVPRASVLHSGNYTCTAPGVEPDTINVFVQGDNTAAIQRQEASASSSPTVPSFLSLVVNSFQLLLLTAICS